MLVLVMRLPGLSSSCSNHCFAMKVSFVIRSSVIQRALLRCHSCLQMLLGATVAICFLTTHTQAQSPFYTDTGSPANPDWATILPTLNVGSGDPGPVYGSAIDVNNTLTETGLYGNRPISVGAYRIYVCCNTSTTNFANFSRWFQVDGNTQVLRLFVNDEGTATSRTGSARTEAFTTDFWNAGSNKTYEWSGRYTVARRQQGYAIFQVKNPDHDWAVQLNLLGSGELVINNRRNAEFEQARLLPFADEPSPPDAQAEPATRSTRP